jgi:hypothetical protein
MSIEMSKIVEHFSIFFRSASRRCTSEKDMEKSSLKETPIRDKSDLSPLRTRNVIDEQQQKKEAEFKVMPPIFLPDGYLLSQLLEWKKVFDLDLPGLKALSQDS